MPVRLRSWLGALMLLGAVLLLLAGGLADQSLSFLLWPGFGCLAAGFFLIIWAFRSVSREIGSGQARLEAMFRSEIDEQRAQKKGPS